MIVLWVTLVTIWCYWMQLLGCKTSYFGSSFLTSRLHICICEREWCRSHYAYDHFQSRTADHLFLLWIDSYRDPTDNHHRQLRPADDLRAWQPQVFCQRASHRQHRGLSLDPRQREHRPAGDHVNAVLCLLRHRDWQNIVDLWWV